MFKKEIKFIYDFNLNEVKKLGNFITYEQLLSANLHPAILQYISADVDYLIFEDRQKILRNSVFDYSGEKIHQQFLLIGEEIKRTKRFSLEYMSKLILHASSFTVNFIARPRWALSKFIFDDENHKNTTEIKQILNYLYYYGHLRRIITSYINRKKILSVNEKEFEDLLYKIDMLSVESNARTIVHNSLKAMADFFNIGENSTRSTIPLKAVELFLSEKNFEKHLLKLQEVFGEEDKRIGLVDCLKTLDEVMYSKVDELESKDSKEGIEDQIESEIPIETSEEISGSEETDESVEASAEVSDEIFEEESQLTEPEEIVDEEVIDVEKEESRDENITVTEEQTENETGEADQEVEEGFEIISGVSSRKEVNETETHGQQNEPVKLNEDLLLDFEKDEPEAVSDIETNSFDLVGDEEFSEPAMPDEKDIQEDETGEDILELFDDLEADKNEIQEEDVDELENVSDEKKEPELSNSTENDLIVEDDTHAPEDETEIKDLDNIEETFSDLESENEVENFQTDEHSRSEEELKKERLSSIMTVAKDSDGDDSDTIEEVAEENDKISDDELEDEVIVSEPEDEPAEDLPEPEESEPVEDLQTIDSSEPGQDFDVSELLENKNLTKVIEVIFDYDIEDFTLTIEKACKASDYEEGVRYLEEVFNNNHVDPKSKEAEVLKSVISEYFNQSK